MRVVNPLVSLAICAFVAVLFALPPRAQADTYQLFNLGADDMSFLGISSTGLAFFDNPFDPSCAGGTCYFTYFVGVKINTSATAPTFTPDNGTSCSPSLPTGWLAFHAVCNNGRVAWTGIYGGNPPTEVYFNTNPTPPTGQTQLGGSSIFMNSIGDVIFDDAFSDDWYEAVDLNTLVTPEPGSLFLLATGILALAVTRRRLALA